MTENQDGESQIENETDKDWIAGWPGLILGLIPIIWMVSTSPRFGFVKGTGYIFIDFFAGIFVLIMFGLGLIGGETKFGRIIRIFVWMILGVGLIYSLLNGYGGEGGVCSRSTPQYC